MIRNFLAVGLGGAVGCMLRYGCCLLCPDKSFPVATFLINVIGSFVIGVVIAYCAKNELFANNWKLFLATGLCGGFTTFSTFSYENLQLLQAGKTAVSLMYIFATILAGIAATWIGFKLTN